MKMQGNISSKGNTDHSSFWRQSVRASGQQVSDTIVELDIQFIRKAARSHWDDLQDYKDAIITVFEVEDTFPSLFFLQEIKNNVIDVKINCI